MNRFNMPVTSKILERNFNQGFVVIKFNAAVLKVSLIIRASLSDKFDDAWHM